MLLLQGWTALHAATSRKKQLKEWLQQHKHEVEEFVAEEYYSYDTHRNCDEVMIF